MFELYKSFWNKPVFICWTPIRSTDASRAVHICSPRAVKTQDSGLVFLVDLHRDALTIVQDLRGLGNGQFFSMGNSYAFVMEMDV